MTNNTNNNRIAKNTTFLFIRMLIVMFVALYTTRIVLNVLGVKDYGVYNVVCGFVSMFQILNNCLNTGINRFYNFAIGNNEIGGVKNIYNAAVIIQFCLVVIILIITESFGLWYVNNVMVIPLDKLQSANIIFQFAIFSLLLLVLQSPYSAAILAYERMNYYALVSIVSVALKLCFVISLQYIDSDKLVYYGLLMLIISISEFLFYFIYCRRSFKELRLNRNLDKNVFSDLLSFSSWSMLDPATMAIKGQGSNMLLNYFFGPIINAAYGIATQVSVALNSFAQNIAIAFRPQIIQSYSSGDYDRSKSLMFNMSRVNFMLQTMLVIPFILEINYVLTLWLGDDFPSYAPSFALFMIIESTLNTLHTPISTIMVATGKIRVIKTISAIILVAVIPLGYLGLSIGFSPNIVFYILIMLTIFNIIVSIRIMTKTFSVIRVTEYFKKVILPCFNFVIIVLIIPIIIKLSIVSSFYKLLFLFFASFTSSLFAGYFVIDKSDRKYYYKIISKFK